MIFNRGLKNFATVLVLLISVTQVFGDPECDELPIIKNGELVLNGRTLPFRVNDTLAFRCDENFRTDEMYPKVTCVLMDDVANWTEGVCKPIIRSCHDPGYIENANRIGNLFTFPHNVTYVCNKGYRMNGLATKFCSMSGRWEPPSIPYCEAISCPPLIHPLHGKVLHSLVVNPGSRAEYKCDRHYKLVGTPTRICQDDGTWTGSNPICEKITCPAPGKLANGRIIGKNGTVYYASDIIIFQCNDFSHKTSKCLDSGEWSERPPVCTGPTVDEPTAVTTVSSESPDINIKIPNSCEDPGTIKNGDKTFMGLHINSTVTYTCDEGYYLRGKATLTCLENGKWDLDKLPICVKPLSAPEIIGIVFGVIALVCIVIGGYLWYRYRMKSIRGYGEKSKALTADATDIEEIAGLEKEKKQIPVTVL